MMHSLKFSRDYLLFNLIYLRIRNITPPIIGYALSALFMWGLHGSNSAACTVVCDRVRKHARAHMYVYAKAIREKVVSLAVKW